MNTVPIVHAPRKLGKAPSKPAASLPASGGDGVKSALRVLTVLEYFAASRQPATLARLFKQLALPKSSCFALLETLRQRGYLYSLGKDEGYYPTRRWLDLAQAVTGTDPILSKVAPLLKSISEATNETAILAKCDGADVIYLDVAEPPTLLRYAAYAGYRKPMQGASGRALLGAMPVEQREAYMAKMELKRFSPHSITDRKKVMKLIAEGAARGWHVSVGEYQADTASIASGFSVGMEQYALVVGAPIRRVENRFNEIGAILARHVRQLRLK